MRTHTLPLTLPCPIPPARSLDADLWLLLTEAEEGEYLARSVRVAAARCADLVPCPAPGCEGLAVAGDGPRGTLATAPAHTFFPANMMPGPSATPLACTDASDSCHCLKLLTVLAVESGALL